MRGIYVLEVEEQSGEWRLHMELITFGAKALDRLTDE